MKLNDASGRNLKGSGRYSHIIVDGSNLARRSFHMHGNLSIQYRGKTIKTGVTFGFLNSLVKLKRLFKGEILITWDAGYATRLRLYPEYKLKRRQKHSENKPEIDDYYGQLKTLSKVLGAAGVSQYKCDGWEADDIMFTLANMHTSAPGNSKVIIASNDHDMYQCLTSRVHQFVDLKKKGRIWNTEVFKEVFGIESNQYLDVLSLSGDSGDGVPGIRGVGEKTAIKAVQGSPSIVDDVLSGAQINPSASLSASFVAKLDADLIRLTRSLVKLYTIRRLSVYSPEQDKRLLQRCVDILELDSFQDEDQWGLLCRLSA